MQIYKIFASTDADALIVDLNSRFSITTAASHYLAF